MRYLKESNSEAESRMAGCQELREGGNREMLFIGYKVSVVQDEKVLDIDCTSLCL